jgi:hypothetical protein
MLEADYEEDGGSPPLHPMAFTSSRNSSDSPLLPEMQMRDKLTSNISICSASSSSSSQVLPQRSMPKDYSKHGILAKKGMGKLFKPWRLRNVFVDLNQTLAYFDGTTLKGEILLDGVAVRSLTPEEADGRSFAFEISNISGVRRTQDNVLTLAASSAQEAEDWINCLRAASCSTVRARALGGPGYMSLSAELKGNPAPISSDMDNVKRLREIRQQQAREKKMLDEQKQRDTEPRQSRSSTSASDEI